MLKLIYLSSVFGPIDFEYDRPVIHVGRAEDNDLVLRHHSIEPYHCRLLFRGETVMLLPPGGEELSPSELRNATGAELGPGQMLQIGELTFSLAHSPTSVALPVISGPELWAGASEGAVTDEELRERYYCANCRMFIQEANVKRVGLVGLPKRNLCPKCSRPVDSPW